MAIVVVTRLVRGLLQGNDSIMFGADRLNGNSVRIPGRLLGRRLTAVLPGPDIVTKTDRLDIRTVLSGFPVAVLSGPA